MVGQQITDTGCHTDNFDFRRSKGRTSVWVRSKLRTFL